MNTTFNFHHSAMLLKYTGISFISGAVNHGFFSGMRSLWTAGIGMVLFVLGAWLEHSLDDTKSSSSQNDLWRTLLWGSLLSIGLGFFTGGLQHFPDSPARSAWVVPLGFFISVLALAWNQPQQWQRSTTAYLIAMGALVSLSSWGSYQWLANNPEAISSGGHSHAEPLATPPKGITAQTVSRSIAIDMDDQMRFTPSNLQVQAGETIRFVVRNTGKVPHEMVLGNEKTIQEHAELMKQAAPHAHDHGGADAAAITVAPGQTGELVVTFPEATTLQTACLIPGHYDAGMRGTIQVTAKHDHSTHKH
jgi:uncharacterized cupredoxin-like copper-binding protein